MFAIAGGIILGGFGLLVLVGMLLNATEGDH